MPATIPDDLGQRLHDRATRGEALSSEEQAQLQEWYNHHDQEEITRLAATPPARDLAELETLVERATAQLVREAQHIQSLSAENAELRREIAALQNQLQEKLRASPV